MSSTCGQPDQTAAPVIRSLDKNDYQSVKALWLLSNEVFKAPFERQASSIERDFFDNSFRFYGCFHEGELVVLVGAKLWRELPYFSIINLLSLKGELSPIKAAKYINSTLKSLLDQMHSEGRFTFFMCTLARPKQIQSLILTGDIPPSKNFPILNRYTCYVEESYNPGEISSYNIFEAFMGHKSHGHPLWIRRYSLQMKYRKYFHGRIENE